MKLFVKISSAAVLSVIILLGLPSGRQETPPDELRLLFMGDIMGHDSQIESAWSPWSNEYQYREVFSPVEHIIRDADYAIANLEVTLGGPPYKGYPRFSSPAALAADCREIGINAFITANNHSCDRGKKGIVSTLSVLDSLNIFHTGVFRNHGERSQKNIMVLEKNNIRVGILNYTYGTNGLRVPFPTVVNLIDTSLITADINSCRERDLDKIIVTLHWGWEYRNLPNKTQKDLTAFLFEQGVDIIIGSHPHVLQPIQYTAPTDSTKETFVAYSLGNFVSNMRRLPCDGGVMVEIVLNKTEDSVHIKESGYHLVWVHKHRDGNRDVFEILPSAQWEAENFPGMDKQAVTEMNSFSAHSRNLFGKHNIGIYEYK